MAEVAEVARIVRNVLQLSERTGPLGPDTPLLGHIPEFDSMAVVSVVTALEEEYGIVVEDDEISAETFETLGSLAKFVNSKL